MSKHISEDDFMVEYEPLVLPGSDPKDGEYLWPHAATLSIPLNRVWTVVEDDEGNGAYALPGYHIVNKIDYVVTAKPWDDEDVDAVWWPPRPLCKHCRMQLDEDHEEGTPWLHSSGERECEDGEDRGHTVAEPEDEGSN